MRPTSDLAPQARFQGRKEAPGLTSLRECASCRLASLESSAHCKLFASSKLAARNYKEQENKPMGTNPQIRVGRLRTVGEIVHELSRLYRAVRRGDVETLEGFRMASILGIMRQCLEGSDAEKRLAELESVLAERSNVVPFKRSNG
jgi:hypothetical protein